MEGKFTVWQKRILTAVFFFILISSVMKGMFHKEEIGIVIILSFVTLLFFGILCVCALFPATWRMTEKSKRKIKDEAEYQKKYTSIFVILNVILSIGLMIITWIIA
jgi:hypothetical protein